MSAPHPRPFANELWTVDGPAVSVAGFRYPTRMVLIRLADGGLFAWSPIALSEELRAGMTKLGAVRFIVAPNSMHHLYLAEWQSAYPAAKMLAAPGLATKRPDLHFDGELGEQADAAWAGELDLVLMRNAITTEAVFFHRASRTVLFTDLVQHFPPGWFSGWRSIVARLDRMTGAEPAVPQKFRLGFVDRKAARLALERILKWPADRVLMAHGSPITASGQAFIARAFGWLSR